MLSFHAYPGFVCDSPGTTVGIGTHRDPLYQPVTVPCAKRHADATHGRLSVIVAPVLAEQIPTIDAQVRWIAAWVRTRLALGFGRSDVCVCVRGKCARCACMGACACVQVRALACMRVCAHACARPSVRVARARACVHVCVNAVVRACVCAYTDCSLLLLQDAVAPHAVSTCPQIVAVVLCCTAAVACCTLELETNGQDLSEDPTNVDALKQPSFGAGAFAGRGSGSEENSRLLPNDGSLPPDAKAYSA